DRLARVRLDSDAARRGVNCGHLADDARALRARGVAALRRRSLRRLRRRRARAKESERREGAEEEKLFHFIHHCFFNFKRPAGPVPDKTYDTAPRRAVTPDTKNSCDHATSSALGRAGVRERTTAGPSSVGDFQGMLGIY